MTAVDQALEAIDLTLRRYHPKDRRSREVVFRVVHWREPRHSPTMTFVEALVYSTRGPDGRRPSERYRFCSLMTHVVEYIEDDQPEHPDGKCGVCTLRWMYYNGLGLDASGVARTLGYGTEAELAAMSRWSPEELAAAQTKGSKP